MSRWGFLVLLACGLGCGTRSAVRTPNVERAAQAAVSFDDRMGDALRMVMSVTTTEYEDPALRDYVRSVGMRLLRNDARRATREDWRFLVVDTDEPGAWALAGRTIYVSRGLLAHLGSEAELAGVLAHEIAHVHAGHTTRSLFHAARKAPALDASADDELDRDEERQADRMAVQLLADAGYDPRAMLSMLTRLHEAAGTLGGESACDRHPPLATRLARAALAASTRDGELGVRRYLEHVEGLVVDTDTTAFSMRGRELIAHQERFVLRLPPNYRWSIAQGRAQAGPKDAEAEILVLRFSLSSQATVARSLEAALRTEPHSVRSLPGHVEITTTESTRTGQTPTTLLRFDSALWFLLGAPAGALAKHWPPPIEPLGNADIPPSKRLTLLPVNEATTLRALRRSCGTDPDLLGRLNGLPPDQRILPGTLLKCVTSR